MPTFIALGIINARRNLARSLLAIASMAIAAAFLVYAVSLSRGYAQLYRAAYRSLLGGEVAVYDTSFIGEIPAGESSWGYRKMKGNPFSDLDSYFPELSAMGYLKDNSSNMTPLDDELIQVLLRQRGVSAVYPRYQIPAVSVKSDARWEMALRGRDAILDAAQIVPPASCLVEGRWLQKEDAGNMVAVICGHATKPPLEKDLQLGESITVEVPRILDSGNGVTGFDYLNPLVFTFEVVGILDLETRRIDFNQRSDQYGDIYTRSDEEGLPLFWQLDELQIPLETWQFIWQQAATEEYLPRQVMLMIDDISYLEDIMMQLRSGFPTLSFVHTPALIDKALAKFLIEDLSFLPPVFRRQLTALVAYEEQTTMPLDLRLPLSILIFLNAALVIASNLLIMINERTKEIGILKAVGALRQEIVQMALGEALFISATGAFCGFLLMRIPATLNQLTNRMPLGELLSGIGSDFLLVFAAALISTIIFGLLPALRMSSLSVNEVLRNE